MRSSGGEGENSQQQAVSTNSQQQAVSTKSQQQAVSTNSQQQAVSTNSQQQEVSNLTLRKTQQRGRVIGRLAKNPETQNRNTVLHCGWCVPGGWWVVMHPG